MIKELSEAVLKNYSEEEIDKMIIDNYNLSKGVPYILLDFDDKGELYVEDEILVKGKNPDLTIIKNYRELCSYEYYSKMYSNKPVASKLIHTTNYLSLSVNIDVSKKSKDESITYFEKLENELIKYFEKLENFQSWGNSSTKNLMYEMEKKLIPINKEISNKFKGWLLENLSKYETKVNIYIRYDLKIYRNERLRYDIYKALNKSESNRVIDGEIFGVGNKDIETNDKKPKVTSKGYLIKNNNNIPHLIKLQDSMLINKVYDMIDAVDYKYIYVYKDSIDFIQKDEEDGYNIRSYGKCYEAGRDKYKNIKIEKCTPVSYSKKMLFNYKNYTDIKYDNLYKRDPNISYGKKDSKQIMRLFKGMFVIKFNEKKDKDSIEVNSLKDWVYKNKLPYSSAVSLMNMIHKSTIRCLNIGDNLRTANLLNLKLSIKDYVKRGIEMDIMEVKNNLKNKLSGECATIDNTEELSVATGQLIAYLISLTESANKGYETKTMLFSLKKNKSATRYIRSLLAKYEYKIKPNKRFNNMYMSVIQGLLNDIQLNEDIVLIGYLSENLLYEKKENN